MTNGVLSGGAYGGVLTVASTDIYAVVVDTAGTSYAPGVIHDLNGARSPSLDIVLLVRPPPASATPGTSVQTSAAVMRFVLDQSWTEEQKKAVLACIEVFVYLRRVPPNHFQRLRMDLEDFLRSILIDPDSIR